MADRVPIAARRCHDYAAARGALEAMLDDLDLSGLFSGKRVLLKVNLMHGARPAEARTTHPAFLDAVLGIVCDGGGAPVVVESSGILGFTDEVFELTGTAAVARRHGAKLVNIDRGPFVRTPVPGAVILEDLLLHEEILAADLRVTLPKLKTHDLTTLTCALKNQFGFLPGGTKCAVHIPADTPAKLGQAIVDIYRAAPVHLGLVDGIVALDGGGVEPRTPVPLGLVAAGTDLVALDAVCGALVGFSPDQIPSTRAGGERGIGQAKLHRIELRGLDSLEPIHPLKPSRYDPKLVPAVARATYHLRGTLLHPVLDDPAGCTECGDCAAICPVDAITLSPKPVISNACVHCYACKESCPEGVLKLRARRWLKPLLRRKAGGLPLTDLR